TIATIVTIAAMVIAVPERTRRLSSLLARFESLQLGAIAIGGALVVALVGRDLVIGKEGMASQVRPRYLFTYNSKSPWPASLDFGPALWFFLIIASLFVATIAVAAWRRYAVPALLTASVLFAAWGIDVYFMKTSPHWGQRETVLAYYRANAQIPG